MPRRDQEMAKKAARLITDIEITPEVRTRLIGLPFLLHRNGLAATLAFIASKSDSKSDLSRAYSKVADTLLWVKRFAEASKAQEAASVDSGVDNE